MMRKILPILLAVLVYLTPLYPIYALTSATAPADLKRDRALELKNKALEKREELREKKDEKIASLKDKMASRSAALKAKLAKFKDKAKAKRVENINNNLNTINKRRTETMAMSLEKMSQILKKLKTRIEAGSAAGEDVSVLNNASVIAEFEVKWSEADAALKAQMEKEYLIDVNKESTVKEDSTNARNSLRADLKSIHAKIVEAKQALSNVIPTAAISIKGGNNGSQ